MINPSHSKPTLPYPSNLTYVVALMKEIGGGEENGKSETGAVGATGVGFSEEGTGGAGICCAFHWKLMPPNTQSIDRL